MAAKVNVYDESSIDHLEGLEGVRQNIGMYAGSNTVSGLHQVFYEVLSNSNDEAFLGYGTKVEATLLKNGGFTIRDYGRGIPCDIHPKFKVPTIDMVFMWLHTGGKLKSNDAKAITGGLHGVGIKIATASCEKLIVDVMRDGKQYHREFSKGKAIGTLKTNNNPDALTGTRITYVPDNTVWETTEFSYDRAREMCKQFAFLSSGVTFILSDERTGKNESFQYDNGLLDMYEDMTKNATDKIIKKPIHIESSLGTNVPGERIDIVFGYTYNQNEVVRAYANNLKMTEGGTHVQGFRTALTKVVNDAARRLNMLKDKDENLSGAELREGLVAAISVYVQKPEFENQTKSKLTNSELVGSVNSIVYEYLKEWFIDNPMIAANIIDKALRTRRAREAARKARELALNGKPNKKDKISFSTKLADCSSNNPDECELYIVEGDSAGNNLISTRNSRIQAILPLRGKVLNVAKAEDSNMLENRELLSLDKGLGCGRGDALDLDKLRYHKIIIATDSDVDKLICRS